MRRTYRSKKDTGGALDHRDVVLNIDEKSSAFDAFYIQNLKQTKRELSCNFSSNHIGAASNRIRKRKYVKRILKEVQPVRERETMSPSAYLTPDKSIRVNKILDPFDLLLNSSVSSSPCQDAPKAVKNTFEIFLPKKKNRTCTRKKVTKVKKYNNTVVNSSSTDVSDKENVCNNGSNITDIRTHELLVEIEQRNSPKYQDESINRIVNNISLLNNFKQSGSNSSFNTSYKCRNRLTNIQSPILQKSPLCSTPFKEKYRGMSIFKFSPIFQKEQVIIPNCESVLEDKDEYNGSKVLVDKDVGCEVFKENQASLLTRLPNVSIEYKSYLSVDKEEDNSNASMHGDISQIQIEHINNEMKNYNISNTGESTIHTTEAEPFLGFSDSKPEVNATKYSINLQKCFQKNELMQEENIDPNEKRSETSKSTDDNAENISDSSIISNEGIICQSSVDYQNSDKESMYDTCNSEKSSSDDVFKGNTEPIVAIERMCYSTFMKYYEKMLTLKTESDDKEISKDTDNDDFESLVNNSNEEVINNSLSTEPDYLETKSNAIVITDSSTTEDLLSSSSNDTGSNNEEECVSFVTTRRRHEITDSMFIFDHSYGSISNACDNTVLSMFKNNLEKSDVNISTDNMSEYNFDSVNTNEENYVYEELNLTNSSMNETISRIATRRSSKLPRKSAAMIPANIIYNPKLIDSPSDETISRKTTRRSSKIPRQSVFSSPESDTNNYEITLIDANNADDVHTDEDNYIKEDSNLSDSPIDKTISSTLTRRSTILPTKISAMIPANIIYDPKFTNSPSNERISKITTRKNSKIPRQSHFSHPISDSSKYEKPKPIDTNEVNNKTIIEKDAFATDSNYLERNDAKSPVITRNNSWTFKESSMVNHHDRSSYSCAEIKPSIVLQPGKKWERSLSIYKRMTMAADHFDQSILDDECKQNKGRKYRQSVISNMEMQECRDSLHNDSLNSRRSTFVSKPNRPTIRFVKDPNISRVSINTSTTFDDLKGFLNEECDDTVIELSKLSIADSEHEVTILDNFHETERVTTARDYVLRRCNQTEPILFDECYPETVLKNCHKIGEGVYGEVFLWRGRDGRARVMKIVPIAGNVKVNGEDQKDFHEIISEIVIAMELSALRAPIADFERQLDEGNDIDALDLQAIENATDIFNEVLAVRCVHGAYPPRLLELWELFDECRGSENDSPAALPPRQHFLVLELANAGRDLESYHFSSAHQAYALFHQIAFGLAVAEESFQFEHRDLHWGNVLIAPTEQTVATFILRGRVYRIPRCGVAATIIDYSLSRLTLPLAADSAALYNDLATDEQLFDAVGDYQFEVYRLMRDKVGNDWKNFEPYTNILWLHYIVDKMITALRYKRTNTKIHKQYIEKLKGIKNRILEYGSAVQYVLTDIEF